MKRAIVRNMGNRMNLLKMWLAATMVAAPGMGVSSSGIILQTNRYCAASVGSPSSARVFEHTSRISAV